MFKSLESSAGRGKATNDQKLVRNSRFAWSTESISHYMLILTNPTQVEFSKLVGSWDAFNESPNSMSLFVEFTKEPAEYKETVMKLFEKHNLDDDLEIKELSENALFVISNCIVDFKQNVLRLKKERYGDSSSNLIHVKVYENAADKPTEEEFGFQLGTGLLCHSKLFPKMGVTKTLEGLRIFDDFHKFRGISHLHGIPSFALSYKRTNPGTKSLKITGPCSVQDAIKDYASIQLNFESLGVIYKLTTTETKEAVRILNNNFGAASMMSFKVGNTEYLSNAANFDAATQTLKFKETLTVKFGPAGVVDSTVDFTYDQTSDVCTMQARLACRVPNYVVTKGCPPAQWYHVVKEPRKMIIQNAKTTDTAKNSAYVYLSTETSPLAVYDEIASLPTTAVYVNALGKHDFWKINHTAERLLAILGAHNAPHWQVKIYDEKFLFVYNMGCYSMEEGNEKVLRSTQLPREVCVVFVLDSNYESIIKNDFLVKLTGETVSLDYLITHECFVRTSSLYSGGSYVERRTYTLSYNMSEREPLEIDTIDGTENMIFVDKITNFRYMFEHMMISQYNKQNFAFFYLLTNFDLSKYYNRVLEFVAKAFGKDCKVAYHMFGAYVVCAVYKGVVVSMSNLHYALKVKCGSTVFCFVQNLNANFTVQGLHFVLLTSSLSANLSGQRKFKSLNGIPVYDVDFEKYRVTSIDKSVNYHTYAINVPDYNKFELKFDANVSTRLAQSLNKSRATALIYLIVDKKNMLAPMMNKLSGYLATQLKNITIVVYYGETLSAPDKTSVESSISKEVDFEMVGVENTLYVMRLPAAKNRGATFQFKTEDKNVVWSYGRYAVRTTDTNINYQLINHKPLLANVNYMWSYNNCKDVYMGLLTTKMQIYETCLFRDVVGVTILASDVEFDGQLQTVFDNSGNLQIFYSSHIVDPTLFITRIQEKKIDKNSDLRHLYLLHTGGVYNFIYNEDKLMLAKESLEYVNVGDRRLLLFGHRLQQRGKNWGFHNLHWQISFVTSANIDDVSMNSNYQNRTLKLYIDNNGITPLAPPHQLCDFMSYERFLVLRGSSFTMEGNVISLCAAQVLLDPNSVVMPDYQKFVVIYTEAKYFINFINTFVPIFAKSRLENYGLAIVRNDADNRLDAQLEFASSVCAQFGKMTKREQFIKYFLRSMAGPFTYNLASDFSYILIGGSQSGMDVQKYKWSKWMLNLAYNIGSQELEKSTIYIYPFKVPSSHVVRPHEILNKNFLIAYGADADAGTLTISKAAAEAVNCTTEMVPTFNMTGSMAATTTIDKYNLQIRNTFDALLQHFDTDLAHFRFRVLIVELLPSLVPRTFFNDYISKMLCSDHTMAVVYNKGNWYVPNNFGIFVADSKETVAVCAASQYNKFFQIQNSSKGTTLDTKIYRITYAGNVVNFVLRTTTRAINTQLTNLLMYNTESQQIDMPPEVKRVSQTTNEMRCTLLTYNNLRQTAACRMAFFKNVVKDDDIVGQDVLLATTENFAKLNKNGLSHIRLNMTNNWSYDIFYKNVTVGVTQALNSTAEISVTKDNIKYVCNLQSINSYHVGGTADVLLPHMVPNRAIYHVSSNNCLQMVLPPQ